MDLRQIKNLMKEFEDSLIHKLEINDKDFSIKLEKEDKKYVSSTPIVEGVSIPQQVSVPDPIVIAEEKSNEYSEVKAPLVGTFYHSPSPDSDPFVSVGSKINKGETLFIIEAMKVMNEITSPVSGTVMKITVTEGSMVEFGQVVMEIAE